MSVDTQKILLLIPLTISVEIVDSTLKYKSEVISVEDLLILLPNWYTYRTWGGSAVPYSKLRTLFQTWSWGKISCLLWTKAKEDLCSNLRDDLVFAVNLKLREEPLSALKPKLREDYAYWKPALTGKVCLRLLQPSKKIALEVSPLLPKGRVQAISLGPYCRC